MFNTFLPEIVHVADRVEVLKVVFLKSIAANLALGVVGGASFYWLSAPLSEFLGHRSLTSVHAISPVFALVFLLMAIANPFLSILPSLRRAIAAAWGQTVATAYLGFFSMIVFFRHARLMRTAAVKAAVELTLVIRD
jgi:hypothetical protein